MKKRIVRLIACLCAGLVLITAAAMFASCGGKGVNLKKLEGAELADAIFDISAQDFKENCITDTTDEMQGTLFGSIVKVKSHSLTYSIDQTTDAPVLHAEAEMVMDVKMGNITQTQERKHIQGYRDGKMYTHRDDDGNVAAFVSDITYAEFEAFQKTMMYNTEDEVRATVKSATVKTAAQKEDGNWTAELSGYTKETLKLLIKNRMDESVYMYEGYRPSDLKISVEITEDHVPVSLTYELVFEKTDEKTEYEMPTAVTTLLAKDFGTATAPALDLSGYTAVSDIRPLYTVQRSLGDYDMQDSLAFTSETTAKVSYGGSLQQTEVNDVVKFEVKDGKYTFAIKETQYPGTKNEIALDMTYEDGRFKLSGKGVASQSQTMTDNEARITAEKLLDPASITSGLVSDIEAGKNGYDYVLTVHDPDYSQYEQGFESLNAKNYKAEGKVSVKLKDGQVTEYRYDFKLTATVRSDTLTVESTTVVRIGQTEIGEGSSAA